MGLCQEGPTGDALLQLNLPQQPGLILMRAECPESRLLSRSASFPGLCSQGAEQQGWEKQAPFCFTSSVGAWGQGLHFGRSVLSFVPPSPSPARPGLSGLHSQEQVVLRPPRRLTPAVGTPASPRAPPGQREPHTA